MNINKITLTTLALAGLFGAAFADPIGQVYTETNAAAGNQVQVYSRKDDGSLRFVNSFATGGNGTGAGLGSQGAVTLSENGRFLYAVDAGSNDLAVFEVSNRKLRFAGRFATGGTTPISVTAHDDLVYVLNAGGAGNIAGFRQRPNGQLEPISSSSRGLSGANVGPAQVQFSPDGETLVVTEKGTGLIDTWPVLGSRPGNLFTTPSNSATPFGFDFDNRGHLVVSEAVGGAPNGSSASSYSLGQNGWQAVTGSAATNQTAACWLQVSPDGRFAYTANAGSGSLSGFSISESGALTLLESNGVSASTGTGSHPVDMGFSRGGKFLYVLANGNGTLQGFRVAWDGSLTQAGSVSGIPTSAQGLAVR